MEFFILQTFVILTLTYFLGAVIGCALRARYLRKADLNRGTVQDKGYAYAGGYADPIQAELQPQVQAFQAPEKASEKASEQVSESASERAPEKRDQDLQTLAGAVAASAGAAGLAALSQTTKDENAQSEEKSSESVATHTEYAEDVPVIDESTKQDHLGDASHSENDTQSVTSGQSDHLEINHLTQETAEQTPVLQEQYQEPYIVESQESAPIESRQSDEISSETQNEAIASHEGDVETVVSHQESEAQEIQNGYETHALGHETQQDSIEDSQPEQDSEILEHSEPEVIASSDPQEMVDHAIETLAEPSDFREELSAETAIEPHVDMTSLADNVIAQAEGIHSDSSDIDTETRTNDASEVFQVELLDPHQGESTMSLVEEPIEADVDATDVNIADVVPVSVEEDTKADHDHIVTASEPEEKGSEEDGSEALSEQHEVVLDHASLQSVEPEEHEISVANDQDHSEILSPEAVQEEIPETELTQAELHQTGSEDSVQQQYENVFQAGAQTFTSVSTLAEEVVDVLEETPSSTLSDAVYDENAQSIEPVGIVLEVLKSETEAAPKTESSVNQTQYGEAEDISYEEISSDDPQEGAGQPLSAAKMATAAFASNFDEGIIEKIATGPVVQADTEKLSRLSEEISSFVSTSKKGRVIDALHEGGDDFDAVQHSDYSSFKKDRPVREDQYVPGRSYVHDDLKRIKGIGILIEQKLKALGVNSYRQIANWNVEDVQYINETLGFMDRVQQENWIEQARILSEGGETLFSKRVDTGEV